MRVRIEGREVLLSWKEFEEALIADIEMDFCLML